MSTWCNLESSGKRVLIRAWLLWVNLCPCLVGGGVVLTKCTNIERPRPGWATPFPRRQLWNCIREERSSRVQASVPAIISFCTDYRYDETSWFRLLPLWLPFCDALYCGTVNRRNPSSPKLLLCQGILSVTKMKVGQNLSPLLPGNTVETRPSWKGRLRTRMARWSGISCNPCTQGRGGRIKSSRPASGT